MATYNIWTGINKQAEWYFYHCLDTNYLVDIFLEQVIIRFARIMNENLPVVMLFRYYYM